MNKAELMTQIATNVEVVGDNSLVGVADSVANIRQYDVVVYYLVDADGALQKGTQCIYVKDEGADNEVAYFGRNEVKNYVEPPPVVEEEA
jgi:hypothetical protein